ncbi:PAS domain S-box protein [Paenibacillus thermoaerophilus]|nr:PAS domain S-box protein [Paenibacillus thermoaerophilus]
MNKKLPIDPQVAGLIAALDSQPVDPATRDGLKQSLQQLSHLKFALDESSIVAITDRRGIIQYVNDKFCEISKYSRDELIGQDHRLINSGHHDKAFMRDLWRTIASGRVWNGDIKNRAKDGTFYWVRTTIVPFLDERGDVLHYLAIRNEVTRLKQVEEDLQQLMSQLMQVQEEERRRFSRELHDGIGQSLFSLLIQIDRILGDDPRDEWRKLRDDVSRIIEDVRGLAWELRPSVLDDLGIVPAIRSFVDNYSSYHGINVRFEHKLGRRPDVQTETVIYRIVQEALTNVAKYAGVDEAFVTIRDTDEGIEAVIEDKGAGIPEHRRGKGVGLHSMEERARSVGGRLRIESQPGRGTRVVLTVPRGG